MNQPFGSQSAVSIAFLLLASAFPLHAGGTPAGPAAPVDTPAGESPAGKAAAGNAPSPSDPVVANPVSVPPAGGNATHAGPTAEQRLLIPPRVYRLKGTRPPPGPLKRLTYTAREGFALRMVSNQDVTAEIRNGAGRTLAYTARTLEPGDWTLRPRNLAPGLYTVLLRTGPNLRVLRMEIQDAERGQGGPEWQLEKAADSTLAPGVLPRGARLSPSAGPSAASCLARSRPDRARAAGARPGGPSPFRSQSA